MNDKVKYAILAGLFVVIAGIGAFQFVKSGEGEAVAVQEQGAALETETKAVGSDPAKSSAETGGVVGTAENDPTQAGAKASQPGETAQVDPALVAAARLNARDPFDGRRWDHTLRPQSTPTPQVRRAPVRRPQGDIGGTVPPWDPTKGAVLPEGTGQAMTAGAAMPSVEDFPYTVTGTIQGERPCVVVTDSAGKQKLVRVGGSIDGDSEVVSISKGQVKVRHRGKTKTYSVGGTNPSNTKQEGN